jgi:predicted CXXCH cytochrome family protein
MTTMQGVRSAAFGAAVCAVLVCAGCGGGRNPNPNGRMGQLFRSGEYVGVSTCMTCHEGIHDEWRKTAHSRALQTLTDIGQGQNAYCLGCHTVGMNQPTGFVSVAETPQLGGVQCESCHGPGGGHVRLKTGGRLRDNEQDIVVSLSAEICAGCHAWPRRPTYTEWAKSKHGNALELLRASGHANDTCLECHSADYRMAGEGQKPTLETAQYPITCVVCHDPHDATHVRQLRAEPREMCEECHNSEGASPGESVHHAQTEMLEGVMGVGGHGNSAHHNIPDLCIVCHRYTKQYENEENPGITGHTFEIHFRACQQCHTGTPQEIEEYAKERQDQLKARLAEIRARLDALPDDLKATQQWVEADFNRQFMEQEGSFGVHNAEYADSLMDAAEARLDYLESL